MSRKKKDFDLNGVDSCLSGAQIVVQELMGAVRSLPKVNADGSSECPFAEELYKKKEKLQETVQNYLGRLQKYDGVTQSLISQCHNDMTVISANADRLNNDQPREHFSDAEAAVAGRFKYLIQLLKKIREMIKILNKAMQEAAAKFFPGKTFDQSPQFATGENAAPDPFKAEFRQAGVDKEIDELLKFEYKQLSQADEHEDE